MGADLYITTLPKEYHDKGYYRDSYNNGNLLWQFGLSYWEDIQKKYCDDEGNMGVNQVVALLRTLKKREGIFEDNMKALLAGNNKIWDEKLEKGEKPLTKKQRKDWVKYYQKHYKELQEFLLLAIKNESGIDCSL